MVSFGACAGAMLLNPVPQSGNAVPRRGLSTAGIASATAGPQCRVSTAAPGSPSPGEIPGNALLGLSHAAASVALSLALFLLG